MNQDLEDKSKARNMEKSKRRKKRATKTQSETNAHIYFVGNPNLICKYALESS